jgi:hypothetical protein
MSVSRNTPIVGQTEQLFVSTCKTVTYVGASVSRVLASLGNLSSSEFRPAPKSATPTSGKSGHIRTFLSRLHGRKSLEKCSCDGKKRLSGHSPDISRLANCMENCASVHRSNYIVKRMIGRIIRLMTGA